MSNDKGNSCIWNLLFIGLCAIPGYYYFGLGGALASSVGIPIFIVFMCEHYYIPFLILIALATILAIVVFSILVSGLWGKFI